MENEELEVPYVPISNINEHRQTKMYRIQGALRASWLDVLLDRAGNISTI